MRTPAPADVLLRDGSVAIIRSLVPDDEAAVTALHQRTSDDNLRLRFFTPNRRVAAAYVEHLGADPDTLALVVERAGDVVALGTAEPVGPGGAEVSFLVDDTLHGLGLGSLLLEHLAAAGRDRGLRRFVAEVLGDNHGMIAVFLDAGFAVTRDAEGGYVHVEMDTAASAAAVDAADERECRAETLSLHPLLYPRSVAVTGVRRDGTGVGRGGAALDNGRRLHRHRARRAPDGRRDRGSRGVPAPRGRPGARRPRCDRRTCHRGARHARRRRGRPHPGRGRHLLRLRGARGGGRRDAARDARPGPAAQHPHRRTQLSRADEQPAGHLARRHLQRVGAAARGSGVRLPVRWRRHRAQRRGPGHGARRRVVRLAGQQGRCLEQRPARRLARRPAGDRRRALPRVVRQRAEVRPLRPSLRRAQAAAGRGRWPLSGGPPGRRLAHRRRGVTGGRRGRAVRPGRRDRLRRRRGHGRDRSPPRRAAAAPGHPGRGAEQRRRHGRAGRGRRRRARPGGARAVARAAHEGRPPRVRHHRHRQPGRRRCRRRPRRPGRGRRPGPGLRRGRRPGRGAGRHRGRGRPPR